MDTIIEYLKEQADNYFGMLPASTVITVLVVLYLLRKQLSSIWSKCRRGMLNSLRKDQQIKDENQDISLRSHERRIKSLRTDVTSLQKDVSKLKKRR